jgi:HEAT repeat protein
MVARVVCGVVLLGVLLAGCEQRKEKPVPGPAVGETPATTTEHAAPTKEPDATQTPPAMTEPATAEPKPDAVPAAEPAQEPAEPPKPQLDQTQMDKVRALVTEMASDASLERRHASEELDLIGPTALDPYLQALLESGTDIEKRGTTAYLIGRVTRENREQVKALIGLLAAADATLRHNAFQALERVSEEQLVAALPELLAQAKNAAEDKPYRVRAVRAVAKLGEAARNCTPDILQLAGDSSVPELQRAAIDAVAKVAAASDAEAFYLQLLQTGTEVDLRRLAASRLLQTANSEVAVNGLIAAFKDASPDVRNEAAKSLVAIGRPGVPFMVKGLADPDPRVRRCVVQTLGVLTSLASDAVPALEDLQANDADPQVRALAGAALKRIQGK